MFTRAIGCCTRINNVTARDHSTAKGTHYEVLEVVNSATLEQIKASYYRLSKLYHPDVNKDSSSTKFSELTESYNVLGNEHSRALYDASFKQSVQVSLHFRGKVEFDTKYTGHLKDRFNHRNINYHEEKKSRIASGMWIPDSGHRSEGAGPDGKDNK